MNTLELNPPSRPKRQSNLDASTATPEHRRFTGQHVQLTPLNALADSDELYRRSHGNAEQEQLWRYLPQGPFNSLRKMHDDYLDAAESSTDPLFLTVNNTRNNAKVGVVSFMNIAPEHRCLELGNIWYAPEAQRTLINTEAIYLMLCHGFDDLGYRRIEWKCNALNERSRHAAQRLGFSFEGIFYQHRLIKGKNRNTAWFAMLDGDWPAIKQAITDYLYNDLYSDDLYSNDAETAGPPSQQAHRPSLRTANRPLLRRIDTGEALR